MDNSVIGSAKRLKQLKELLDIGAITQEEFEYKKIALLNPEKEEKYLKALELIKQNNENSLSNAVMLLNSVGDYRNAEELLIETTERAEKAKNKALYDNAIQLMEENTIVSFNNAIDKFRHITDGYDVQELITSCEERIVELKQQKEEKEKQRKLEEEQEKARQEQLAIEKEKQQKATKRNIVILVIVAIIALVGFFAGTEIKKSNDYKNATQLLASEQYQQAYDLFNKLGDYKDAKGNALESIFYIQKENLSNIKKGQVIKLGNYCGQEIEWIVLTTEKNKALLLSKNAIDILPFNEKNEKTNWEDCSLRVWLNEYFYNQAFTGSAKQIIVESNISMTANKKTKIGKSKNTVDNIFLLSYDEVDTYLTYEMYNNRICRDKSGEIIQWWLRTNGSSKNWAAVVDMQGDVPYHGHRVVLKYKTGAVIHNDKIGVRPAMWISLK